MTRRRLIVGAAIAVVLAVSSLCVWHAIATRETPARDLGVLLSYGDAFKTSDIETVLLRIQKRWGYKGNEYAVAHAANMLSYKYFREGDYAKAVYWYECSYRYGAEAGPHIEVWRAYLMTLAKRTDLIDKLVQRPPIGDADYLILLKAFRALSERDYPEALAAASVTTIQYPGNPSYLAWFRFVRIIALVQQGALDVADNEAGQLTWPNEWLDRDFQFHCSLIALRLCQRICTNPEEYRSVVEGLQTTLGQTRDPSYDRYREEVSRAAGKSTSRMMPERYWP